MKIGDDVYFICNVCEKLILRDELYYILQLRKAGTKYAHEWKTKKKPIHLCLSCEKKLIKPLHKE